MKIHTVRKYLNQLTQAPPKNLTAHYKILSDAVCKSLGIRPINGITLAVVGQDSAYTASAVSAALKHAGISSATVNFDISCSPEAAVTVNGEQLPAEVMSRIMTVIRTVERTLCSKNGEDFTQPSVYEVFLLGALCACSEMGVSHIILHLKMADMPQTFAPILPQPKIIHCNEIFPTDAATIKLIARKNVEEIISAPQQKDSRRALYNLCNELNCNHTVIARGEIEIGSTGFRGISFTYRGFTATSGTRLPSLVAVSAATLVTIRELTKLRIKVTDEDALAAINYRKIPGRGEMISVRPYTLCCTFCEADRQSIDLVVGDLRYIAIDRKLRIDMIVEPDVAVDGSMTDAIANDEELSELIGDIVVVGQSESDRVKSVNSFAAALENFPYFKDHRLAENVIMIVCGSQSFIDQNIEELEEAVRDEFSY